MVLLYGALWIPKWHAKVECPKMELRQYITENAILPHLAAHVSIVGMCWCRYGGRLLRQAGVPSGRTVIGVASMDVSPEALKLSELNPATSKFVCIELFIRTYYPSPSSILRQLRGYTPCLGAPSRPEDSFIGMTGASQRQQDGLKLLM